MDVGTARSYKDLVVWQKAIELVAAIYKLTEKYPEAERYNLVSQMRRSAVSIPSNIAEGRHRGTKKDFLQFLRIAYASGTELETQVTISKRVLKDLSVDYANVDSLLSEVLKMLNVMIHNLYAREYSQPRS